MNSSDLTANLYFSAAVRVAADVSLTRLLPLDALRLPLAPHDHYSQRVLLRGMARPTELPMSTLAIIFAHEVTRLDDEYLALPPSLSTLSAAVARHRTIH